jgi:hypothetical protein
LAACLLEDHALPGAPRVSTMLNFKRIGLGKALIVIRGFQIEVKLAVGNIAQTAKGENPRGFLQQANSIAGNQEKRA